MCCKISVEWCFIGEKAVILAGTGPVGQRAAAMLGMEGANVTIVSRQLWNAEKACETMQKRFNILIQAQAAADFDERADAIQDANIVIATGATGIELLKPEHWQNNTALEMLADANATPPLGIGGIGVMDKGIDCHGKIVWGCDWIWRIEISIASGVYRAIVRRQ